MSPLRHLADHMAETYGLRARGNWRAELERAASVLCGEVGCSIEELPGRLGSSPALSARFAGLLTVGETHFFRHPHHLDRLVEWLPDRLGNTQTGSVKIWSAGCATGEEPYSIAIAIDARLGNETLERIRIVGSDVDLESVNRARRALYRSWSFRGAPAWLLGTYFDAQGDGWARLRTSILRGAVHFDSSGVYQRARDTADRTLDAIFFRNVAIYLEDALLERLYRRFSEILAPDGLLFLGPSDPRPDGALFVPSPLSDDRTVMTPRLPGRTLLPHIPPVERPETQWSWAAPALPNTGILTPPSTNPPVKPFSFFPLPTSEPSSTLPPSLAVRVVGTSSAPPAPATVAGPAISTTTPTALQGDNRIAPPADSSDEDALTLATRLVEAEHSADAYALRAQIHFEAETYDAAVADMRSAIFLRPHSPLNLYLYACMLEHSTHPQRARGQLEAARAALKGLPADMLLEDEETTAGQLRDAVALALSRPAG